MDLRLIERRAKEYAIHQYIEIKRSLDSLLRDGNTELLS
ncbi:hypothetical protein GLA29479_611 [Lysobacter antibioticus]|nr:hypothetical protein GLA29479_611 [Lysobacter antibioticus]